MADDMKIGVVVGANTKGFSTGMREVQGGLASSGASMGKFSKMGVAGFAMLGVAAAAAGAAIIGAFIVKATKKFIEFEATMIKTSAIMGKTGMQDIPDLAAEVRQLGSDTKSTTNEVAQAAQILALAGLSSKEMVDDKALYNLNQLAIAAGVDIPTAAAVAIPALKGMGLEVDQLKNVNDVLLNTMTKTFTDLQGLGESMKFLAPTARAAGISIEEAAAAVGILGNAGLQGSMAGTALRMAITKLIKPTDDARKLMDDLGLDFFTLSPAGQAAKTALREVGRQLEVSKVQAAATNAAMKALNEELSDLSIEQQTNSLAIMKIKRRAEKEGRELSSRELEQIDRLESANSDLNITMAERRIEQQVLGAEQTKTNETLKNQETQYSQLNKTVGEQTMGITSLSDVFTQLNAAGVSTNQMFELFGVRGGTAANAMLASVDALDALTASNHLAQEGMGKTNEIVDVMSTSTLFGMQSLSSAWEKFMIDVGEQFAPMLVEEVFPALMLLMDALIPLIPAFAEIAVAMGEALPPILEALIPMVEHFAHTMELLAPIIKLVGWALEFAMYFMEPVLRMFSHIAGAIVAIIELDFEGVIEHITGAFGAWFEVLNPIWRIIKSIASMLGFDMGGLAEDIDDKTGFNVKSAAAGAGMGMMVGGPVGAAIGGAIGGFFFADGGIVSSPTLGVVGEAGPEVVIPVDKLDMIIGQAAAKKDTMGGGTRGQSVVINGGIHIGAGNNLNKRDVKAALEQVLPQILSQGTRSGARGVI